MFEGRKYSAPKVLFDQLAKDTQLLQKPGLRVLDVGIGTGLLSEEFKRANPSCHITGMDISAGMLERCRAKGVADDVIQLDFQSGAFPFEDGSFDVVVSSGVFELLSDTDHVIGEMGRVLKPGGAFSFTTYSDSKLGYMCRFHPPERIDRALDQAGLKRGDRFRFHAFNDTSIIFIPTAIFYHLNSGVKDVASQLQSGQNHAPLPPSQG